MSAVTYPVHVDAQLDSQLSRWLLLVKWLLAIPHFIVLLFLFIAFLVLTILAFFAPHRVVLEHIARNGVTPEQAALLLRVLRTVPVDRTTLIVLRETARRRPPQNVWNRLRWHLRMRTLSEVVG